MAAWSNFSCRITCEWSTVARNTRCSSCGWRTLDPNQWPSGGEVGHDPTVPFLWSENGADFRDLPFVIISQRCALTSLKKGRSFLIVSSSLRYILSFFCFPWSCIPRAWVSDELSSVAWERTLWGCFCYWNWTKIERHFKKSNTARQKMPFK